MTGLVLSLGLLVPGMASAAELWDAVPGQLDLNACSLSTWSTSPTGNLYLAGQDDIDGSPTIGNEQAAADGTGGFVIAWTDERTSDPYSNPHVYARAVDALGRDRWSPATVSVLSTNVTQWTLAVVPDGVGGAILVLNSGGIRAQRISATGVLLWGAGGIALDLGPGLPGAIRGVPDGAGGAYLLWTDSRNNATRGIDLYAQRIDAAGVAQWTSGGRLIVGAPGMQSAFQIQRDPRVDGFVCAWIDGRDIATNGNDLYAQRIGGNGAPRWSPAGLPVCAIPGATNDLVMAGDAAGHFVLAWQDTRAGSNPPAIYAQQLDSLGHADWMANGARVHDASSTNELGLAIDVQGTAFLSWRDFRFGTSSIYAQKLTASGAPAWNAGGMPVCVYSGDRSSPGLAPDQQGGVVVAWSDTRRPELCDGQPNGGDDWDQYAQRLSANGVPRWTLNGIPISNPNYNQFGSFTFPDGNGGLVRLWDDHRAQIVHCSPPTFFQGRTDIYAQRVDRLGRLLAPEASLTSVTDTPADQGNRLDVQWKPSPLDQASLPRVVEYRIWRQAPLDTPVVALTVPATSACSYSATITTPVDSIVGVPTPDVRIWVEARNATTGESWITLSKRGLAFDNLVPPVPGGLQAQMTWTGTRWLAASTWRKSTAPDVKEYRLYRSAAQQLGGAVSAMGHFLAATTDTAWNDSLFDATEPNYYVLVVDQHGNVGAPAEAALTNLVGTPVGPGEGPAVVGAAAPSPSRGEVHFRIRVPAAGEVVLSCHDVTGRLVSPVLRRRFDAGEHELSWPGRDVRGAPCPAGVYYVRITFAGQSFVRRCVRL